MKLERIIFVGLCLVVSLGLVLVNMGMCQQDKPGEKAGQAVAPAPESTQKPAAAPKGKVTVDVWDTDRGLPQNSVTAIAQTSDGYLWLGTFNGLVRFDGLRFQVFTPRDTPGLVSDQVTATARAGLRRRWRAAGSWGRRRTPSAAPR